MRHEIPLHHTEGTSKVIDEFINTNIFAKLTDKIFTEQIVSQSKSQERWSLGPKSLKSSSLSPFFFYGPHNSATCSFSSSL